MDNLSYSVTEIYGIKSSGKYGLLEPVYHELYRIYGDAREPESAAGMLVTEDTNSGYEFFLLWRHRLVSSAQLREERQRFSNYYRIVMKGNA